MEVLDQDTKHTLSLQSGVIQSAAETVQAIKSTVQMMGFEVT